MQPPASGGTRSYRWRGISRPTDNIRLYLLVVAVPRTLCEHVVTDRRALFPRPTCPRRVLSPPRPLVCRDIRGIRDAGSHRAETRPAAGMQENTRVGFGTRIPDAIYDGLALARIAERNGREKEREREREREGGRTETRGTSREPRDPPKSPSPVRSLDSPITLSRFANKNRANPADGWAPFRICIHEISPACAHVRDDLRRPREISRGQRTRVYSPSLLSFSSVTDGAGKNRGRRGETRRPFPGRARATRSYLFITIRGYESVPFLEGRISTRSQRCLQVVSFINPSVAACL